MDSNLFSEPIEGLFPISVSGGFSPPGSFVSSSASLSQQKVGFVGVIRDFQGEAQQLERLRELGFVRGETVTVRALTPFKDPMIVEIRGTVIALRLGEAQCIQI